MLRMWLRQVEARQDGITLKLCDCAAIALDRFNNGREIFVESLDKLFRLERFRYRSETLDIGEKYCRQIDLALARFHA